MMGVDEPDYGHLLDDMEVFEDAPVAAGRFLLPAGRGRGRVRARRRPAGRGLHRGRRAGGHRRVRAVDRADRHPDHGLEDQAVRHHRRQRLVGRVGARQGAGVARRTSTSRPSTPCSRRNGEVVAEGRSDAVLGNPVTAVAWLARKVDSFGVRLKAGDVVLPGSCTRAIDARPGDEFRRRLHRARFSPTVFRVGAIAMGQNGRNKLSVAIVGSGNISTDLLYKLLRSEWLEPRWMVGIDPEQRGPGAGPQAGPGDVSHEGVDWLLGLDEQPDMVFEATSAYVHRDARAALRRGRHPRHRPDPGGGRSGGDPAREPARAPRRAERQHDHLRRPGHHPDRVRGVARSRRTGGVPTPRSSPRCRRRRPDRAPGPTSTSSPRPPARASRPSAAPSGARRSSSSTRPTRR